MTEKEKIIEKCKKSAEAMRIDVIRATYNTGNTGAHIGGTLSMIEIMSVLYTAVMQYNFSNPEWNERDRFILSKGHGALAQYAAMKQVGLISENEFYSFKSNETFLYAHPCRNKKRGIEFSSGSLGQGISLGVGVAIALKKKKSNSKVYVLVGDGECNEGSVWEALLAASKFKLDNLTIIVDKNNLQYDGSTDEILPLDDLGNKFKEFGFDTFDVDGHNVNQLLDAFSKICPHPKAIVAHTVKGKGVSYMENIPQWHNGRLSEKQYITAMQEQGVDV